MGNNQNTADDRDSMEGENDDNWIHEEVDVVEDDSNSDGSSDATFDAELAASPEASDASGDDSLSHASDAKSQEEEQKVRERAKPDAKLLTNAIGILVDSDQPPKERQILVNNKWYKLDTEGRQAEPLIQPFLEKDGFSPELCVLLFLKTKKSGKFYTPSVGEADTVEFEFVPNKTVKAYLKALLKANVRELKSAARAYFTPRKVDQSVYMSLFGLPAAAAQPAVEAPCAAAGTPKASTPVKTASAVSEKQAKRKRDERAGTPLRNPGVQRKIDFSVSPRQANRKMRDATLRTGVASLVNDDAAANDSGAGPADPPQKKRAVESIISDVNLTIQIKPEAVNSAFVGFLKTFLASQGEHTAAAAESMLDALTSGPN
jgi:hypothetical protein